MSSLIDHLKRTCFDLKNLWKNPTAQAVNQAEQVVKGLEEMIGNSVEFQKASPSELLKTVGYELWNLCVEQSKKMGNSKSESKTKFHLVRVRRVACYVIEKSIKASFQTLKTTHDMIRLYTKTARDYNLLTKSSLDVVKDSNKTKVDEEGDIQFVDANPTANGQQDTSGQKMDDQFSIDCFNKAASQAELFLKLLAQQGDSSEFDKSTETALSNILTLYIDRADSHFQMGDNNGAFANIQSAKRMVEKLPHEIQRISMIEYNYAVDLNSKERYDEVIRWLKDSFELYELDENKNLQKQSRTLRLLSNAYLETKMFDQGLNCVQMANNMTKTYQGLFLEVRLFAKLNREEEVERSVQELLRNPETPLNLSISALNDIVEQGFNKVAFKCYKKLLDTANSSDQEPRVLVRYFNFLVNHYGEYSQDEILKIIDRMVQLSQSANSNTTIVKESLKEVQCILWNIAWKYYQKKDYPKAIVFYNYSLKILPMDEMIDRAKVLRSIARCHLEDSKLSDACQAAENAEQLDPKSLHSHYLMYQINIKEKNITNAKNYMKKMMHDDEFKNSFLAISAHDAFKENMYDVAIVALEALLQEEQSTNSLSLEVSQILRTLTYLSTLIKDKQKVLKYLQMTKDFLFKENVSFFRKEDVESELEWFHRVAWNHGCESVNEMDYDSSFQFYSLASTFYSYRQPTLETFSTQKYCYLMKIHCSIEEVNNSEEYLNGEVLSLKNREKLQLMLDEVQNCKKLLNKIQEFETGVETKKPADKVFTLLYLAELQILVMLKCDEVLIMDVINSTSKLEGIVGPNIFEAMASICLGNEKQVYYQSARHSLQTALRKAIHTSSPNYSKAVHLFTSLIQICRTREESMSFFEELLKLLNQIKPNDHFLKSEQKHFVWLCTESWNNGVYYYKLLKNDKSQQWMKMSVKLCCYLDSQEELSKTITERYALI